MVMRWVPKKSFEYLQYEADGLRISLKIAVLPLTSLHAYEQIFWCMTCTGLCD